MNRLIIAKGGELLMQDGYSGDVSFPCKLQTARKTETVRVIFHKEEIVEAIWKQESESNIFRDRNEVIHYVDLFLMAPGVNNNARKKLPKEFRNIHDAHV